MSDISQAKIAKWPASGDLFLIGSVCAWGINFPIAKTVLGVMSPMVFSSTRYLMASALLFLLLLIRGQSIKINRSEALQLLGIGLLGIALFQGGWAYGLSLTTASKSAILVSTAPVFGAIFARFKGEKTSLVGWFGIILSLLGVAFIINNSLTEITFGGGSLTGDLLCIAAGCVWALYTTVSGSMVARRGPVLVTAWGMLFGAGILTVVASPDLITQDWSIMTPLNWLAWMSTAILGAALAFIWYCAGIARLGITRGMSYSFFIPVIAILTSVLFIGESMSILQIGGAVIVLLGIRLSRVG